MCRGQLHYRWRLSGRGLRIQNAADIGNLKRMLQIRATLDCGRSLTVAFSGPDSLGAFERLTGNALPRWNSRRMCCGWPIGPPLPWRA